MQKTKISITIMTILIILGIGLLVYGLTTKGEANSDPFTASEINAAITLTPKAEIKHISPFKNLMALHIDAPEGENIYFLDPQTGNVVGNIGISRAEASDTQETSTETSE